MKKMIVISSLFCLAMALAAASLVHAQPGSLTFPDFPDTPDPVLKSEKVSGPLYKFTVNDADALIHGITVGLGKGAVLSNTALGLSALHNNNGGQYNTAVAVGALFNNTTGQHNTATGFWSMVSNTTGSRNTAYGAGALFQNVAGENNTAIGYRSLINNNGSNNTGIGHDALTSNTTGVRNTAIGSDALKTNSTGRWNTAIGHISLNNNTTGEDNVAVGSDALSKNTTGSYNTSLGSLSLENNITGSGNTAIGISAGRYRDGINNSTFLGRWAYASVNNLSNVTGIGYDARPTKSNQMVFGDINVTEIGGAVNWSVISDGTFKSNVREDVAGLDFIMLLRPVTYNIDVNGLHTHLNKNNPTDKDNDRNVSDELSEQAVKAAEKKAAIVYSGFVAQEVEAAARKLTYDFSGVNVPETDNEYYSLSYAEFVVPIVKAIQDQQQQIESLQPENVDLIREQLDHLTTRNEQLEQQLHEMRTLLNEMLDQLADNDQMATDRNRRADNNQAADDHKKPSLEQNTPNPFHENTVIGYYLPENAGSAQIVITDMNGIQVRTIDLHDRGSGRIMLQGQSLSRGQYIYSLVVNGRLADSKRMVIL